VKRSESAFAILAVAIMLYGCQTQGVRGDGAGQGQATGGPAKHAQPAAEGVAPTVASLSELPGFVVEFLKDPAIPRMDLEQAKVIGQEREEKGRTRVRYRAPDYWGSVSYYPQQAKVVSCHAVPQPWVPQTGVLSEAALRQRAVAFAQRRFPDIWNTPHEVKVRLCYPLVGGDGTVQFMASPHDGRIAVWGDLVVEVSVGSGDVLSVSFQPGIPEDQVGRLISYETALERARPALTWWGEEYAKRAQPIAATCSNGRIVEKEFVNWCFLFLPPEGLGTNGYTMTGSVSVDALSGDLGWVERSPTENEHIEALIHHDGDYHSFRLPSQKIDDTCPCWLGGDHLAFGTLRPYTGQPEYCGNRFRAVAVAEANSGRTAIVVPAYTRNVIYHAAGSNGSYLAVVSSDNGARLLDLRTGVSFSFGSADRPVSEVTCSPNGSLLAFSAYRRHGDDDIFSADLDFRELAATNQRRLARLDGYDCRPEFAPTGDMVFFAHCPPGRGWKLWAIMRVGVAAPYWDNAPPEMLVSGFGPIGRLSFFPDGRRLLVWHEGGLEVVDVAAKTRQPLALPELHDPDLPQGPPLKLRDPAVSPDGRRLAFSGYRDAGEGKQGTGWYIYVCNLDGSELRRVTPLSNDPVEPYVFPESGKTAFDVAKEIARQRMADEKE